MATAKQKAWRAEFARRYGRGKRYRTVVRRGAVTVYATKRRRSGNMARRRFSRRRSGGGGFGMNGIIKAAAFSLGASMIAPRLGVNVDNRIVGAAAGYFANKSLVGAAVGYFAPQFLSGMLGSNSSAGSGWTQ